MTAKKNPIGIGHTDAGPPSKSGVLNVVAILEHKPLYFKISYITGQKKKLNIHDAKRKTYLHVASQPLSTPAQRSFMQTRTHRSKIGKFSLEGRNITERFKFPIIFICGDTVSGGSGHGVGR